MAKDQDFGSGVDRTSVVLVETIPDGVGELILRTLGAVSPPLGAAFTEADEAIAERLLRGQGSLGDYEHARAAGWQMWRYQD